MLLVNLFHPLQVIVEMRAESFCAESKSYPRRRGEAKGPVEAHVERRQEVLNPGFGIIGWRDRVHSRKENMPRGEKPLLSEFESGL